MILYRTLTEGLDVEPLVSFLASIPQSWWNGERSPQAIRLTDARTGHAMAFAPYTEPIIRPLVDTHYPGARLGTIVLSCLPPQMGIKLHTDPDPAAATRHRVHVPLVTNPHATLDFPRQQESVQMKVGSAYEIDSGLPHRAVNRGADARIHLIFDAHLERTAP